MNLIQDLTERVASWETLGHPALLDRFILRNGKTYTPAKRIGHKRKPKECFANAAKFVMKNPEAIYVEGYVINDTLPIPIHHAWVTMRGGYVGTAPCAMDPTLDAENYQYLGIEFDTDTVRKELVRNGVWGILDHGFGINHRLMFKIDPELEAICKAVMANRKQMESAK